ncbi:efflux RND transporter periplasmic adaptor subunit [Indioceanicola profundi]|uniref:efflux RND transporter periplasmic adaptor subunit n=1 Tax=Indioceanicola profundi TaxID=2220096 RepID=UPI000E6AD831|nr:efflux RND transporter periplasmic adaptor subunit [Indioceanicola profundi]
MKRTSLLAFAAVAALAVGAVWFIRGGGEADAPAEQEERRTAVVVAPARSAPVEDRVEAIGTIRPQEQVVITAETEGVIRELRFRDGERVEDGAVLATLDSEIQQAELNAANAELEEAQAAFDRAEELRRRGTVAQAQLDEALATLRTTRSRVALAQARLDKRSVRAPFAGVLSFRRVSPGAYVQPGDAIATLYAIDTVEVEFRLPEQYLGELAPGQPVSAAARAFPGRSFQGKLAEVDTGIDPATRQAVIRAAFDNPDRLLRPGMLVGVELLLDTRESVVLPETAITSIGPSSFVFVADSEGKVSRRAVTLGRRMPGRVEIAEGVEPGESVVVDGAAKLTEGDLIEARPVESSPISALLDPQVAEQAGGEAADAGAPAAPAAAAPPAAALAR